MTGQNAGRLMAVIRASNSSRLGAMLNAHETDWASRALGNMAKIRPYDHGFKMNCEVVHVTDS